MFTKGFSIFILVLYLQAQRSFAAKANKRSFHGYQYLPPTKDSKLQESSRQSYSVSEELVSSLGNSQEDSNISYSQEQSGLNGGSSQYVEPKSTQQEGFSYISYFQGQAASNGGTYGGYEQSGISGSYSKGQTENSGFSFGLKESGSLYSSHGEATSEEKGSSYIAYSQDSSDSSEGNFGSLQNFYAQENSELGKKSSNNQDSSYIYSQGNSVYVTGSSSLGNSFSLSDGSSSKASSNKEDSSYISFSQENSGISGGSYSAGSSSNLGASSSLKKEGSSYISFSQGKVGVSGGSFSSGSSLNRDSLSYGNSASLNLGDSSGKRSSYTSYSHGQSTNSGYSLTSQAEEEKHYEEKHAYPKYEFKYGVEDKHTGDIKQHEESRDGDVVKGYYSLHEPDGTILVVHYTVTKKSGFNAVVERKGHANYPQKKH